MDNQHLAEMILKQIDTFPESFRMDQWGTETACGTVACIAGHAMLHSGYQLTEVTKTDLGGYRYEVFYYTDPDDRMVANYGNAAQRLLGMSDEERYGETAYGIPRPDGDIFLDMNSALPRFRALVKEGRDE